MKHDEVSTEQLAANLEKQVEQLRDTVAFNFANVQIPVNKVDGLHPSCTTLVDDQLESAHSREKAGLQKALAARVDELQAERAKSLDALDQLRVSENRLKAEREKNATQNESIGQCFTEIHLLQDNLKDAQNCIASQEIEIENLKRLVALRTHDLSIYQKALEDADARVDDAEYKAAELERDLALQRAWTWFFLVLSFVAAVVRVVK